MSRAVFLLFVVALSFILAPLSGCKRACQSEKNCKRTCTCDNEENNASQDCTVAFLCEQNDGAEKTCEADYDDFTCTEMCEKFAAKGKCGTSRCEDDGNCIRRMQCAVLDAEGNASGQFQDCEIPFVCDANLHVCPATFNRSDDELCATCCNNPGEPCEI